MMMAYGLVFSDSCFCFHCFTMDEPYPLGHTLQKSRTWALISLKNFRWRVIINFFMQWALHKRGWVEMNHGEWEKSTSDFSNLECRLNPGHKEQTGPFPAERGLTGHAPLHRHRLGVWKPSHKVQLYFLHMKKSRRQKSIVCTSKTLCH